LLPLVFGEQWGNAGVYLQIVALMFLAKFVVNPLSQTLVLLERQGTQLAWDLGRLVVVNGAIFAIASSGRGATTAVAASSLSMLAAYLCLYGLPTRQLSQAAKHGLGPVSPPQVMAP